MMHVRRRRRSGRRNDRGGFLDGCDVCSCDFPSCNFGLFSSMLLLGSTAAGVAGRIRPATNPRVRPGRRGPAHGVVDQAGLAAIRGYRRWLSHRLPTRCRFTPTCSAYGLAAVDRYGLAVGGRMAADRVRRCRPSVTRGTQDPVP